MIKTLEKYPSDTRVVVQGYEDGFDDVSALHSFQVEEYPDPKWYYGNYDKSSGEGAPLSWFSDVHGRIYESELAPQVVKRFQVKGILAADEI